MKKILVVDDSALMRRIICDIIETDSRFVVQSMAANGEEALELLKENTYDAMILDIEMPKLDGLGVLKEMEKLQISTKVVIFSSVDTEGTDITIRALELGAVDFVRKPAAIFGAKNPKFMQRFLDILYCAASAKKMQRSTQQVTTQMHPEIQAQSGILKQQTASLQTENKRQGLEKCNNLIVAIASSTGGPKALQNIIPLLPKDFPYPILVVQHMPAGFTQSLAERLNELSQIRVKEAENGETILPGTVYIAKGGLHMEAVKKPGHHVISLRDGDTREGVKPCANYMFESLANTDYDGVVCVVLTGMGADGTEGIQNLLKSKPIHVIAQNQETCVVYGMPRSIANKGLANQVEPINQVAKAIIKSVGVQ